MLTSYREFGNRFAATKNVWKVSSYYGEFCIIVKRICKILFKRIYKILIDRIEKIWTMALRRRPSLGDKLLRFRPTDKLSGCVCELQKQLVKDFR